MLGPNRSATLLVALALTAGSAQAQTVGVEGSGRQSDPSGNGAFLTQPPPGGMRASKLVGVEVVGLDNVRVGKVEDVVVDGEGRVRAVVMGVGGFLGIGEKQVAVPFDQIAWNMGEPAAGKAQPTSIVKPENAPSAAAADTAGPGTMPGATTSNDVLNVIEERRSGEVTGATGSVGSETSHRGRATVPVVGSGGGPVRAVIRLTKAALQAAPAFRYDGDEKR